MNELADSGRVTLAGGSFEQNELDPPTSSQEPVSRPGAYDHAKRRRGLRKARERGCSIYIAADELERAGFDPDGPAPYYRVWGRARGGILVRLYREP